MTTHATKRVWVQQTAADHVVCFGSDHMHDVLSPDLARRIARDLTAAADHAEQLDTINYEETTE